ncbi:hypothetical protein [Xenorhabdus entomophaga]|uniref:hypothetical protein n=1 Tax=Xenorhabdus entomophaga TaxID=3136257 RepID=UPI0030F48434
MLSAIADRGEHAAVVAVETRLFSAAGGDMMRLLTLNCTDALFSFAAAFLMISSPSLAAYAPSDNVGVETVSSETQTLCVWR